MIKYLSWMACQSLYYTGHFVSRCLPDRFYSLYNHLMYLSGELDEKYDLGVWSDLNEERITKKEKLLYNVSEDLLVIMEDIGVTRQELADRLGVSDKDLVIALDVDMTIGMLSDICHELGVKPPKIWLPVEQGRVGY